MAIIDFNKWVITEAVMYAMGFSEKIHIEDAEDLVQDCFISFHMKEKYSVLPIDQKKKLFVTILKNRYINNFRDVKRKLLNKTVHVKDYVFDDYGLSKTEAVVEIDYKALQLYMKEREDRSINIFHLFNIGYSKEELCKLFNIKETSFNIIISKGRLKLMGHLKFKFHYEYKNKRA